MIRVTNGKGDREYATPAEAILGLALTMEPDQIGRLRLELHKVQLRRQGVPVTPFKRRDSEGDQ